MTTTERVTVSLHRDLVEAVDRLERNRSRFFSQAVEHELERRSREALMQSVRNPHPVTRDLAERALDAWLTSASTDDESLPDESAGMSVRWIEGTG